MNTKFFIDTEDNDDQAYLLAMKYACKLSKNDNSVKRIVLYINSKEHTGWFERLYGSEIVKKLFRGIKFSDCPTIYKFETKHTYRKYKYGTSTDVVISCGMDSKDIFEIDDNQSVKYVIAIPWEKTLTEKWITAWDAIEISGKAKEYRKLPEPSCIVKKAMESLTRTINMTTGISHPNDKNRAKTFVRALHKYEPNLSPEIVYSYLIKKLNWKTQDAKDITNLIETLNNGKYFHGGEKTGLQNYYKHWKNQCK